MATENVPVIVLGRGITALGVLRSFARRAVPVFGVCETGDLLRDSRFYRDLPGYRARREPIDGDAAVLESLLCGSGLERAVLFPCSDHFCASVAALPAQYDERFPRFMPSRETVGLLNDKGALGQLLERLGIPHPFTVPISGPEDIERTMQECKERLFLKPRDSAHFFARYGVKAFLAESVADAQRWFEDARSHGIDMVLQAYVAGPASLHAFIDGFRDRDGALRGLFARQRLRIYPANFGNSSALISVPIERMERAAIELGRLLAAVDYRGIFSAEFKWDGVSGTHKLLEVNTRPWWQVAFAVNSGADICTMAYRAALGMPVANAGIPATGSRWIYPSFDFHAVRELRSRGERISWLRWGAELIGAEQPEFAWDDPRPALMGTLSLVRGRLRRIRSGGAAAADGKI